LRNAVAATGNNGWVGDVSSNLLFFGARGSRQLSDHMKAVFEFETELMYSATTGTSDRAPDGTAQNSGLGSRNSYVGLQSATLGAIKLGKNDTPYKSSTGNDVSVSKFRKRGLKAFLSDGKSMSTIA